MADTAPAKPLVGIIAGSRSDFPTMEKAVALLDRFEIPNELRVISAHRSPDLALRYAETARTRGLRVVIAAAGGAAHLAGVIAAKTQLPVIGVPIQTPSLGGLDSLLSMVQMPRGIPVATVSIGGAENAALLAVEILALGDEALASRLSDYRAEQSRAIADDPSNEVSLD
ncbi:MAG: 5-(carboxyamino)imidazole ribonucleotide mutase [Chloroflexi bacterium]|nr:5-(carboxyamino)imidazole ribonucleotide mutase [Chloroflexota bacterium]